MSSPVMWQKSSFSGGGDGNDCLEIAAATGTVRLRESDAPAAVLTTIRAHLAVLLRAVKAGALDDLRHR